MLGCFFPTSVILLDDNSNHLNSLASEINELKVIPILMNNSLKALHFLQHEYKVNPLRDVFLLCPEDQEFAHGMIDVDIKAIHKAIFNPDRFEEITVLVTDYAMPDMHGIDFLKSIKSMKLKKIMLTGEAEANLAVQAFNQNLIQKFIRKDEQQFTSAINNALDELQEAYFKELSGIAIDSIVSDPNRSYSCLDNPAYPALFNKICEQNKIIEYYLLDDQGSYLMADLDGNLTILTVASEESMEEFYNFAKHEDAPSYITDALRKREKLVFFFSEQELQKPPTQWAENLYPIVQRETNDGLYYALIKDVARHIPNLKNIVSYKEYLEKL